MKYLLLALFSLTSLIATQTPEDVELMDKLNKLEILKKEISEKEKYIDQLGKEGSELFDCISYGYDTEQKKIICTELNKLEQLISHALINNKNIAKAIREQICPSLTAHRNELNRMQHITVRACVEYFLLTNLYQQYNDIVDDIFKIQFESQI